MSVGTSCWLCSQGDNNNSVGEKPIAGFTVELFDRNGLFIMTVTSDASGFFKFMDISPGEYSIIETNLVSYLDITDSDGGNTGVINVGVSTATSERNTFVP